MASIRRLAPEVLRHIAAGEVIERPASALKEILENSLDAGAKRITVEVSGAGRALLRVADDGAGMGREDLELCLERHATSKIAEISDLSKLSTFGFRGEALFAIAAVSRLTITSARTPGDGWRVEAEGGRILRRLPAPGPRGTLVEIRDLFFNAPARLKFLRSDSHENSRLAHAVEEAGLANPEVSFILKSERRQRINLTAESGKADAALRRRAQEVLGREAADLLCATVDRTELRAWIFFSPPDRLAPTRALQHWLVNRRPVQSRTLQTALYRAFSGHRASDRHPVCVAHVEVPPDRLDANVHPGKLEVRFRDERIVHELIAAAVQAALARAQAPASVGRMGPFGGAALARSPAPAWSGAPAQAAEEILLDLASAPAESPVPVPGGPAWFSPPYRCLGQIEKTYLVFEADGGLFILDPHAAQERLLFERYLARLKAGRDPGQRLMLPFTIELPASRARTVLDLRPRLKKLGFDFEPFGKTGLNVVAAPEPFATGGDLREVFLRLLDHLADPAHAAADTRREAAATIACKAAVKAHDPLSAPEALRLLEDLRGCDDATHCPHGRPSMLAMTRSQLARRFGRPGAPPR